MERWSYGCGGGAVELRILGELQIIGAAGPLELGPLKQRLVLAALAVDAGRSVPPEVLIDRVWDSSASIDARGVLYTYVTRIRRLLSSADTGDVTPITLARRPSGYLLGPAGDRFDLHRLRTLAEQARELGSEDPRRVRLLREAVDLWRGDPLDGLPGDWAARVREGLRQQLLGVLLDWADSELRQGRPGPVADRLARALERDPLAEPVVLHLMRALHLGGRRAEALDQYARTRALLADELGVDPGAELRKLHQEILHDELPTRFSVATVEPVTPPVTVPPPAEPGPWESDEVADPTGPGCQLPAALPDHTGCEAEIAEALTLLAGPERSSTPRPPLILAGPGGIGKTSLSIRLAYLLRDSYPDGQIFVGLDGRRGDPAGALNQVLRALGVSNVQQLRTLEEKLGQYRAALSGRRILIVLDSAVSGEEVLPLVPGAVGSALIASSRARLTTIPGAHHLEMQMFRDDQSLTLLGRIIGTERLAAEPEAARTVVEMCAGLPLALRIAGARLAARPHRRISRLADRLRDERGRLDELTADGLAVRASVAVGYRGLSPAAQRVFRLLGFMDSPSFADWLAAALTGETVDMAEEAARTARRRTAGGGGPGPGARGGPLPHARPGTALRPGVCRPRGHRGGPAPGGRPGAAGRHGTVRTARGTAAPRGAAAVPAAAHPGQPGVVRARRGPPPARLAGRGGPRPGRGGRAGRRAGMDGASCALADALVFASFAVHNDFVGWDRTHAAALGAARKAGNRVAQAVIECGIALLRYKEDRFAEAERYFSSAITLFDQAGHQPGAAAARNGLGSVLREVGRHRDAIPLLEAAAVALTRHGDEDGAAYALYGLGHCHRERGDDARSIEWLEQAIDRYRALDHWRGETIAVRGIGLVHRARGDLEAAELWCSRADDMASSRADAHLACYTEQALAKVWLRRGEVDRAREPLERSLSACHRLHDRLGAALVRRTIGEMHLAAGRLDTAHDTLQQAYGAWRELDHDLGQARTLRDLGAVHALRGDRDAAHAAWDEARSTFQRLGTRESGEADGWHLRWNCPCDLTRPGAADRSGLAGVV